MKLTLAQITEKLKTADEAQLAALERALVADERKGVKAALAAARRRLDAEHAEDERLAGLYAFQEQLAQGRAGAIVGLDEVGRGPVAGPLAVGAVVLPDSPRIAGLNDSKQVKPAARERIAEQIKHCALAFSVCYIEPAYIDQRGMTASLKKAFSQALAQVEAQGVQVGTVLLDGNPLHFDARELSVVKGDAQCASIAAASILAKVERDALMCEYAKDYPEYHLDENKGYASAAHIEAIKRFGLSPIHRASFCTAFTQPTLF